MAILQHAINKWTMLEENAMAWMMKYPLDLGVDSDLWAITNFVHEIPQATYFVYKIQKENWWLLCVAWMIFNYLFCLSSLGYFTGVDILHVWRWVTHLLIAVSGSFIKC